MTAFGRLQHLDEICEERNRLVYWLNNWEHRHIRPYPRTNVDILELTVVLNTLGFKTEKIENTCEVLDAPLFDKQTEIHLEFLCKRTGIKGTLSKKNRICTCTTLLKVEDANYWNYLDCGGPFGTDAEYTTAKALLPHLPAPKSIVIGNILNKIFSMIDVEKRENAERSSDDESTTSFDTTSSDANSSNESFFGSNYSDMDVDDVPNISPPTGSSTHTSDSSNGSSNVPYTLLSIHKQLEEIRDLLNKTIEMTKDIQTRQIPNVKPDKKPSRKKLDQSKTSVPNNNLIPTTSVVSKKVLVPNVNLDNQISSVAKTTKRHRNSSEEVSSKVQCTGENLKSSKKIKNMLAKDKVNSKIPLEVSDKTPKTNSTSQTHCDVTDATPNLCLNPKSLVEKENYFKTPSSRTDTLRTRTFFSSAPLGDKLTKGTKLQTSVTKDIFKSNFTSKMNTQGVLPTVGRSRSSSSTPTIKAKDRTPNVSGWRKQNNKKK